MTYSEAVEIMRYAQKCGVKTVRFTVATRLAEFSFPMEKKLLLIESYKGGLNSLAYLLEPFRYAESDYHKGLPPKQGGMMKISDILGIKE